MRFLCVCLPARQAGGQAQRWRPPLRLIDAETVADAAQAEAGLAVMLLRPAGEAAADDVVFHIPVMQEMHAVHRADDAPCDRLRLFAAHDHQWHAFRRCQQVKRLVVSGAVVVAFQEAQVHLVFLFLHVFPFLSLRQAAGSGLVIALAGWLHFWWQCPQQWWQWGGSHSGTSIYGESLGMKGFPPY